ncbi:MAG TPA: hypothetical protein VGW09_07165 [Nitrososphaeraceae archaeon]|nr:hypothetical protein [Nitrososphaeraceae archaeon]
MSEEGGSINENTNLSGNEEEVSPTEHEAVPNSASENEHKIVSPVTGEGTGIVEAATEEAMRGQDEPLEPSVIEQPQSELQVKPKKQSSKTIMRIQSSLADASNRIKKQTTQINKINQNLQSLQKQMKAGEKQTGILNQIRSQMNKTQKQISQVYKIAQKRSDNKLQSNKKVSSNTRKRKKNKVTRMRQSKS